MERTHAGAGCEELQAVGRTHIGAVRGGLFAVGRTHTGIGEECEEEGGTETTYDELTASSIPHRPAPLGGRRQRKSGEKSSPGSGWEGVFKI